MTNTPISILPLFAPAFISPPELRELNKAYVLTEYRFEQRFCFFINRSDSAPLYVASADFSDSVDIYSELSYAWMGLARAISRFYMNHPEPRILMVAEYNQGVLSQFHYQSFSRLEKHNKAKEVEKLNILLEKQKIEQGLNKQEAVFKSTVNKTISKI